MKARLPQEYQRKSQTELLKQAQEMQQNITDLQAELDEREFTASVDGDLVKVTVNGKHELKSLQISDDLIEDAKDDKEMLEDMIMAAINKAVKLATDTCDSEMDKVTGGFNIPGFPEF